MKTKIWFMLLAILIINGCGGGGGGSSSSFDASNNAPVVNNIVTTNEQNISSIVKEENGEYKVYVNENQRTAFKINAKDNSRVTYHLSEGDWRMFDIDMYSGEFCFKDFTDFETKKEYHTKVIIDDGLGHITEKKVTIYVIDSNNEITIPSVTNSNDSLSGIDESKYFITTWKTDNNGTSSNNQITIPTLGDGYHYSVDWGDGSSSQDVTKDITHTYSQIGTYRVKISGDFPRINFGKNMNTDALKILSIEQWGTIKWHSMGSAFEGASNLVGNAIDKPNLSNVTDMSWMFDGATSFNQDIGNWNVSNVTDMQRMFSEATSFNQDIGNWDVSNVTFMLGMFENASSLEKIPSWYHE